MKRFATLAIILLALVAPAAAQTYPGYFMGEELPEGTYEVTIWPYDVINGPISMPPPYTFWYEARVISTGATIEVDVFCLANETGCLFTPGALEYEGTFPWIEDARCYALAHVFPEDPSTLFFQAWSFHSVTETSLPFALNLGGCLKAQTHCCPWYDFDPTCPVWVSQLFFNQPDPPPPEVMDDTQAVAESE